VGPSCVLLQAAVLRCGVAGRRLCGGRGEYSLGVRACSLAPFLVPPSFLFLLIPEHIPALPPPITGSAVVYAAIHLVILRESKEGKLTYVCTAL